MGNPAYILNVLRRSFTTVFGSSLAGWILLLLLGSISVGLVMLVRRTSWKKRGIGLGIVVLAVVAAAVIVAIPRPYNPRPLQFDGDSKQLQRTQIVSTLDTPVERGKNVVWCASFQAAWKKLQTDLAKEPVILTGAEAACARLNASPMPEVPDGELYAAAGWEDKGIIDEIRREKERMFPGSAVPEFPGIVPGSFVAYGYLHSRCKFDYPYFDSTSPLQFTDSAGKTSPIHAFGTRAGDDNDNLTEQVEILYRKEHAAESEEFALDLCRNSEPTQVVFARVPLEESLQATLLKLEEKMASYGKSEYEHEFTHGNVLLVAEIAYKLAHFFDDLQARSFENAAMAGRSMHVARQEIQFRLDKSGAEVISEARMYKQASEVGSQYVASGPFLVYLKKRGAQLPYFAMWVDNDELLTKWQ